MSVLTDLPARVKAGGGSIPRRDLVQYLAEELSTLQDSLITVQDPVLFRILQGRAQVLQDLRKKLDV